MIRVLALLSMGLLGGCSGDLLTSASVRVDHGKENNEPGVIYALPRTLVSVTVTLGEQPAPTAMQKEELARKTRDLRAVEAKLKELMDSDKAERAKLRKSRDELIGTIGKLKKNLAKVRGLSMSLARGAVIADPYATYRIVYEPASLRTETVTVATTPAGLLKSVSTVSKDEVPGIAKDVIQVAAEGVAFFSTGAIRQVPRGDAKIQLDELADPPAPTGCAAQKDFTAKVLFDPLLPDAAAKRLNEVANAVAGGGTECIRFRLYDARLTERYNGFGEAPSVLFADLTERLRKARDIAQCNWGVCYTRPGTLLLEASHMSAEVANLTGIVQLSVPQAGQVGVIDFGRANFVENSASAEFSDGMLTRVSYTDPSEVWGFVSIPIDALKAIFGIPAQIFDTGTAQAEAQATIAQGQLDILLKQVQLEQSRLDLEQDALSTPTE